MTLKNKWEEFEKQVLKDFTPEQIELFKITFYSGAYSSIKSLQLFCELNNDSDSNEYYEEMLREIDKVLK